MIIKAFATYLQSFGGDIPSTILLSRWLKERLESKPENNIDKIIHHEICLSKNNFGMFIVIGKSSSGRRLMESLYNFALSYDQQKFTRWIHKTNANEFNE